MSIIWLPGCFAILLPATLLIALHHPARHRPPISAAASASQVIRLSDHLQAVDPDRFGVGAGSTATVPAVGVRRVASGDGGAGIFFLVFPLMMAGVVSAVVLTRRPRWGIGRRVVLVAGAGALAALAAYATAVGLHVLPGKPVLLVYAFLLTQLANVPSIAAADGAAAPDG